MLHEFTREDSEATDYSKYFNRLVNVELHTNIEIGGKYYFRDAETNDCYKVMLTQLNKSDLVDKLITPT
ncbi:MAG: hypothetical protein MJ219_03725 [Mycoplasmoidaceae bacterium]|nr:hypothetical protein [Mycoplasmoidaceae bacterium]